MRKGSVLRSDGTESPILEEADSSVAAEQRKPAVKYGELVILGYNGFLPPGDRGRRRSKFVLYQRPTPSGVKRSKHYVVKTPHSSQAILDSKQHSISYTLSRNQAVIVEYMLDQETDMFQIGRSSESPIDFVVMDTIPGDKSGDNKVLQSTISRFACRILADRSNPKVARIYAAGFDSSRNIFLGEKATKWQEGREIDGLTTNGVLIWHPRGAFCGGEAQPGLWREVSVGGGIFSLRQSRSAQQKGEVVEDETNVLRDGTLIDLCGATLLWRSAEGLENSPVSNFLMACAEKRTIIDYEWQEACHIIHVNCLWLVRRNTVAGVTVSRKPNVNQLPIKFPKKLQGAYWEGGTLRLFENEAEWAGRSPWPLGWSAPSGT
ncbi:Protein pellino [Gryllus bimaculatus]|nr:Protein pellino [Gryllus bimaculatus]